jgi:hypothetical protein
MNLASILLLWVCIYSLADTIWALSRDSYPEDITSLAKRRTFQTFIYIFNVLAAAISLWEVSRSYFGNDGGMVVPPPQPF